MRREGRPGPGQEEIDRGNARLRNSELIEKITLSEAQAVEEHTYRIQLMNLEPPAVAKKGWSANGNYYADKALEDLARLLNNKKSMASGHHSDAHLRETAGIVKNVMKIPDRKIIEGDYVVLGEAQKWLEPLIQEQIKTPDANLVSLSINAGGSYFWGEKGGKRGKIVESGNYGNSIDVVFDAAAGGNFKKIIEEYRRKKMDFTLAELKETRPELVKIILAEQEAQATSTEDELKKKIKELEDELKKYKDKEASAKSQQVAEELVKKYKLNEEQSLGLMETLLGKDEAEMTKLVEARVELIRKIAPKEKITNLSEKEEQDKVKPLTEAEKTTMKQLNLTEDQFRIGRGEEIKKKEEKVVYVVKEDKK